MPQMYNPKAISSIDSIEYAVSTAGNVAFQTTIGTSDSPNYSANPDKAAAVAQVSIMSPLSTEVVV